MVTSGLLCPSGVGGLADRSLKGAISADCVLDRRCHRGMCPLGSERREVVRNGRWPAAEIRPAEILTLVDRRAAAAAEPEPNTSAIRAPRVPGPRARPKPVLHEHRRNALGPRSQARSQARVPGRERAGRGDLDYHGRGDLTIRGGCWWCLPHVGRDVWERSFVPDSSNSSTTGATFRAVSLFAGIGGLELGFKQAGASTRLLCEVWAPAQTVLRERFPGVPLWSDVGDRGVSRG